MKKPQSADMPAVRQKRFPSGNPDLGQTNAIPRCEEYDLKPAPRFSNGYSWLDSEQTFKQEKPGNCVRKDGRS
jgi:hypothetical protein